MPEEDEQAISPFCVSREDFMLVSTLKNSGLEDVPTHVFSELPANLTHSCETCQSGCAAYRWVKQQPGVGDASDRLICRVCASLIVLVGKPSGLPLR